MQSCNQLSLLRDPNSAQSIGSARAFQGLGFSYSRTFQRQEETRTPSAAQKDGPEQEGYKVIQNLLASALLILPLTPVEIPDIQSQVAERIQAAKTKESPVKVVAPPPAPNPPPSAPKPVQATTTPQTVPQQIRSVFGPAGNKAVAVSWCESRHQTTATNGQYRGLFQMGLRERARFGHGPDALTQIRAAHRYFLISGFSPWKACL